MNFQYRRHTLMEMPVDILNRHMLEIENAGANIDGLQCALDADKELQRKFIFIPIEEIEKVEITAGNGGLTAGSGPEGCTAQHSENPNWLYNHAVNALALMRYLQKLQAPVTDTEIQKALEAVEYQIDREQNRDTPDPETLRDLADAAFTLQRFQVGGRA
jgi:hypothetical protein